MAGRGLKVKAVIAPLLQIYLGLQGAVRKGQKKND
jgi:hypothetical protein